MANNKWIKAKNNADADDFFLKDISILDKIKDAIGLYYEDRWVPVKKVKKGGK